MTPSLERWQVYYLLCRYTKPHPKDKYIVIACIEPKILGFLINSRINPFITNRPYLLPCEVTIRTVTHPFLNHDSFVDCRDAFEFTEAELGIPLGMVDEPTRVGILEAVRVCPVIKRSAKRYILQV